MIRAVALAAAASLLGSAAGAAETGGCGRFAWDLGAEQALLANATPGVEARAVPPAAFRLALAPAAAATLPKPPGPDMKPRPGFAGAASLTIPQAGIYRVTLSGEAWIDAVQRDAFLPSGAFSGVADCPGMRKSVTFALEPGPLLLQIRGAGADAISLAVTPDR